VKMHSITWYIVDVFVGVSPPPEIMFLVSGCSRSGHNLTWENGVVGTVGHRRSSTANSFVKCTA